MEITVPNAPADAPAMRTAQCCVLSTGSRVATVRIGVRMATKMIRVSSVGWRTTARISANETPPATPIQARATSLNLPLRKVNRREAIR